MRILRGIDGAIRRQTRPGKKSRTTRRLEGQQRARALAKADAHRRGQWA